MSKRKRDADEGHDWPSKHTKCASNIPNGRYEMRQGQLRLAAFPMLQTIFVALRGRVGKGHGLTLKGTISHIYSFLIGPLRQEKQRDDQVQPVGTFKFSTLCNMELLLANGYANTIGPERKNAKLTYAETNYVPFARFMNAGLGAQVIPDLFDQLITEALNPRTEGEVKTLVESWLTPNQARNSRDCANRFLFSRVRFMRKHHKERLAKGRFLSEFDYNYDTYIDQLLECGGRDVITGIKLYVKTGVSSKERMSQVSADRYNGFRDGYSKATVRLVCLMFNASNNGTKMESDHEALNVSITSMFMKSKVLFSALPEEVRVSKIVQLEAAVAADVKTFARVGLPLVQAAREAKKQQQIFKTKREDEVIEAANRLKRMITGRDLPDHRNYINHLRRHWQNCPKLHKRLAARSPYIAKYFDNPNDEPPRPWILSLVRQIESLGQMPTPCEFQKYGHGISPGCYQVLRLKPQKMKTLRAQLCGLSPIAAAVFKHVLETK